MVSSAAADETTAQARRQKFAPSESSAGLLHQRLRPRVRRLALMLLFLHIDVNLFRSINAGGCGKVPFIAVKTGNCDPSTEPTIDPGI